VTGILWLIATLLLVLAVQRLVFRNARCNQLFSANTLGFITFAVMIVSYVSGVVVFRRQMDAGVTTYLCLSVIAYGAGALLAGSNRPVREAPQNESLPFMGLIAVAMLYVALSVPDALRVGSASLQQLRAEHWAEFGEETGPLGVIRAIGRVAAVVLVVNLPILLVRRNWIYAAFAVAATGGLFAESAASGGRFVFAFFIVAAVVNAFTFAKLAGFRPPVLRIAAIAVPVAIYAVVVFPQQRNPRLTTNPAPYFMAVDDVSPAPWIIRSGNALIRNNVIGLAFTSSYFSAPFSKLQYSTESIGVDDWNMGGSYNVRYLRPLYEAIGFERASFFAARLEIAQVSNREGYTGNPWSTGYRDLLIDFGWIGGVFAAFGVGWMLSALSAGLYERRGLMERALAGTAATCGLVFPLISPFVIGPVFNSTVGLMVICLALSITGGRGGQGQARS